MVILQDTERGEDFSARAAPVGLVRTEHGPKMSTIARIKLDKLTMMKRRLSGCLRANQSSARGEPTRAVEYARGQTAARRAPH